MATNKRASSSGGFFVSREPRTTAGGVFTTVRGPSGTDVTVLNRSVYEKASAKAGRKLRAIVEGDRSKDVA